MNLTDIKYPETEDEFIALLDDYNKAYRKSLEITEVFGLDKIDDESYDGIVEDFRFKFPESAWLSEIEVEEVVEENAIVHSSPMLSTEKAYSVTDLVKWFKKVDAAASELHVPSLYKLTCKLDGFAGDYEFDKLSTRGDGIKGNDITRILAKGVQKPEGVEGRGEIVVVKSYFENHLKSIFSHPRNMMSSVLAEDVKPETQQILDAGVVRFVPYSTLPSYQGTSKDIIDNFEKIIEDIRNSVDYLIDGFVLESVVPEVKDYMGFNSHHYKWQIAFKERGDTALPTVLDIKLQLGRTGTVTPVLALTPVLLSGAVISNVTAHHMNNIRTRKIGIGSVIKIIRSGEVIPKIEEVITEAEYEMPTHCPCCSTELKWESHFLFCPNHAGCSEQIKQTLQHFFSTLDNNDGFGGKTISKLVDAGFSTLPTIYAMSEVEFVAAGFGNGESANLVKALAASRNSKIEDWRFLAAFGISDLGRGDSKKLLQNFSIDALEEITVDKLIAIKGYGDVKSLSIPSGILKIHHLIKELRPMFNLELSSQVVIDTESPFSGKNVVVTGSMNKFSRKEIEAFFTSKGAKVQSKVSKTTNYLVYGEGAGSKFDDAKALQDKGGVIEILTEDAFIAKFEV